MLLLLVVLKTAPEGNAKGQEITGCSGCQMLAIKEQKEHVHLNIAEPPAFGAT